MGRGRDSSGGYVNSQMTTTVNKTMPSAKEGARRSIEGPPDQATWDDIMYALYGKQKMDAGLRAAFEGRIVSHEEAKRRLLGDGA